jgi:hypothetical protein
MAKLSELVLRIAEVTGIPEATVREVSRRLREGGLIQTGKGGRYGGADMTPTDAASLLTGLLIVKASSASFAEIASLTKAHLRGLTAHSGRGHRVVSARWDRRLELSAFCGLKSGHAFGDAVAALIASFSNGEFERRMPKWGWVAVWIEVCNSKATASSVRDPEAMIEFETEALGHSTLLYIQRRTAERIEASAPSKWSDIAEGRNSDLLVGARIRDATLKSVGLLLRNSEPSNA